MSDAWRPLPIWSEDPAAVDMARLRRLKDALWLDYRVVPQEAVGSIDTRCLAWGSHPPFLAPHVLVDPQASDDELLVGLAWVLGEGESPVAEDLPTILSALMGPGVREVPAEELAAEQRLADYERGA